MTIQDWLDENLLKADFLEDNILQIQDSKYLVLEDKEKILDENFNLVLTKKEQEKTKQVDYLVFLFGNSYYYTSSQTSPTLTPFKYIGKANIEFNDIGFQHLGVHGQYELMNGTRKYEDWCKKANFLGVKTLGICENQTLAGTFKFQKACQDHNIKPILGQTSLIKNKDDEGYKLKLFAKDEVGWNNLLHINKAQLVDNVESGKFIDEKELYKLGKGLVCIVPTQIKLSYSYIQELKKHFDNVYYQIDPVEWKSNEKDKKHLLQIKDYLNHHSNHINPILIADSYYLDRQDAEIKKKLNKIGKVSFQNQSNDQYFKSVDEILRQLGDLFNEEDKRFDWLINTSFDSLHEVEQECNFEITSNQLNMPKFSQNTESIFYEEIEKGFDQKIKGQVENEEIYLDRVEHELSVIQQEPRFLDYFMILWDACTYADNNNIGRGLARGSGGGSLISYLLNITKIDPIKWDLLFSRFLNEGRIFKEEDQEVVVVETEDEEKIFKLNEHLTVERKGEKIQVQAKDLKETDLIE